MSAVHASASQIATAMQVVKSSVIRRAETEAWPYLEEAGRGGTRRLYVLEQLPASVRAALAWHHRPATGAAPEVRAAASAGQAEGAKLALRSQLEARAAAARGQASLQQAGELAATAQARMDARLSVVRAFETFAAPLALPVAAARLLFADTYNAGGVAVPPEVRALVPRTSDSTVERWQAALRKGGITALAGAYGNRRGSGRIDSQADVMEFVRGMLVQFAGVRATQVMRGLQARFGGAAAPVRAALPSMRALERWVADWRSQNHELACVLRSPDEWKNKYMAAQGRLDEDVHAMNDLWMRDSSPADLMCTDGRYNLIAGIDVFTRNAVMLVSKTSKATAVAAHLRQMLLAHGVPLQDKTDNGSDYTAPYTERVYAGLGIAHKLCNPYSPWEKGHIERFFGTFVRDLVELHPAFTGHSVADAQALRARRSFADRLMKKGEVAQVPFTGAELQTFCNDWVNDVYRHHPHAELAGRTPFEMAAAATGLRRIQDERALDLLLAEAPGKGTAIVQKRGVHVDGAWFIAPELALWAKDQVSVKYDPFEHCLGTLFVFGQAAGQVSEQFICRAYCPERVGVDRREVAIKGRAMQKQQMQEGRRILRQSARKLGIPAIVDEIMADAKARNAKVLALPRPATAHTSAGLEAAAEAAAQAAAAPRTTADIAHMADVQAARARIAAEAVPTGAANPLAQRRGPQAPPVFESVPERIQWLLRQALVRALSTEEQDSLAQFKRGQPASYRRMAEVVAEQVAEQSAAQKEAAPGCVAGSTGAD